MPCTGCVKKDRISGILADFGIFYFKRHYEKFYYFFGFSDFFWSLHQKYFLR